LVCRMVRRTLAGRAGAGAGAKRAIRAIAMNRRLVT
jgi:hypothetical protein